MNDAQSQYLRPQASLEFALALAKQELSILPLYSVTDGRCTCSLGSACTSVGKHPAWARWQQKATADLARIKRSWPDSPDVGVGIHLGFSKLIVLDVDPRNGGGASISALEAVLDVRFADKASVVVDTGGGGRHYYFRFYDGLTPQLDELRRYLSKCYPGIDLLYGMHYAVAPFSMHRSGERYQYFGEPDWEWVGGIPSPLLALPESADLLTPVKTERLNAEDVFANDRTQDMETSESVARVQSALEYVSADCNRAEWLTVLFALHSTAWKCSEMMARDWSRTVPERFNKNDFLHAWNSAKNDRPKSVTVGTLFHLAKQNGWVDPRAHAPVNPETYGDLSNGRRAAVKYRGALLYCLTSRDWYHWDRLRWSKGGAVIAMQAAKAVADEILYESLEALRADPTEGKKRAHTQALGVHRNSRRLEAMLSMAATEPGMNVVSPAVFDNDQWLLGVQNGVVDLRKGILVPSNASLLISKLAGTRYDTNAKCPRWDAFLAAVFEGDDEQVAFMQRLVGYCLTGCVDEEKLFFLHGRGRNGKSVFRTVLAALLGEYAETVGSALLTKGGGSEGERYVSRLVGARLATANEVGVNDVWDDERLKQLTSRDTIPTRQLYGEAYSFHPTHKMLICGNHQPGVHDAGDGMWRRLVLVPFKHQFTEAEVVPDLDQQLIRNELPGILSWAVQGCLAWQNGGLRVPGSIVATTETYRRETDLLGLFFEARTLESPGVEVSSSQLYACFKSFCDGQGIRAPSNIAFGRQVSGRGFSVRRSNGQRFYQGLSLADEMFDDL